MCDHQVSHFLISSIGATYRILQSVPIFEDLRQSPINPYGASKETIARMFGDLHRADGSRHVALRYCGISKLLVRLRIVKLAKITIQRPI